MSFFYFIWQYDVVYNLWSEYINDHLGEYFNYCRCCRCDQKNERETDLRLHLTSNKGEEDDDDEVY